MKKILLIVSCMLALVCSLQAQADGRYHDRREIYVGIETIISISAGTIADYNTVISVSNGKLRKLASGKYGLTVCSNARDSSIVKIYDQKTLVDSIFFRLKVLPDPVILIRTQDKEIMFKRTMGVRAEIENVPVEGIPVTINSFLVNIIKKNGAEIKMENTSAEYSVAVTKAFEALVAGDRVILSDFHVTVGCETVTRKLSTVYDQVCSGKALESRR